jgi:hypothetical protein
MKIFAPHRLSYTNHLHLRSDLPHVLVKLCLTVYKTTRIPRLQKDRDDVGRWLETVWRPFPVLDICYTGKER